MNETDSRHVNIDLRLHYSQYHFYQGSFFLFAKLFLEIMIRAENESICSRWFWAQI